MKRKEKKSMLPLMDFKITYEGCWNFHSVRNNVMLFKSVWSWLAFHFLLPAIKMLSYINSGHWEMKSVSSVSYREDKWQLLDTAWLFLPTQGKCFANQHPGRTEVPEVKAAVFVSQFPVPKTASDSKQVLITLDWANELTNNWGEEAELFSIICREMEDLLGTCQL